MVVQDCHSGVWEVEAGESGKVIPSYTVQSRPVLATRDPISREKKGETMLWIWAQRSDSTGLACHEVRDLIPSATQKYQSTE